MNVIISCSNLEEHLCPLSDSIPKALVPLNGKPLLQYTLNELYKNIQYIDNVIIVKYDTSDLEDFLDFNIMDDFFRTKVRLVKSYSNNGIFDDFRAGVDFITPFAKKVDIVLLDGGEFVYDIGSIFHSEACQCEWDSLRYDMYRFNDYNIIDTIIHSEYTKNLADFVYVYAKNHDFGVNRNCKRLQWNTEEKYAEVQASLIELEENPYHKIKIDTSLHTIEKENIHASKTYSPEFYDEEREIQYNLFSEASFQENVLNDQSVFLPKTLDFGVNIKGEYFNNITEEYVPGMRLSDYLMSEMLSEETWQKIIIKATKTLSEVLHIEDFPENETLFSSYVPANLLEEYKDKLFEEYKNILDDLSKFYDESSEVFNSYHLENWYKLLNYFIDNHKFKKENIIYNFSCGRVVHDNISFDTILYDSFSQKMNFINPRTREWQIVDIFSDYAGLYLSTYVRLHCFTNGRYIHDCQHRELRFPKKAKINMDVCNIILDNIFKDDSVDLKVYSILLGLKYVHSAYMDRKDRETFMMYLNYLVYDFLDRFGFLS